MKEGSSGEGNPGPAPGKGRGELIPTNASAEDVCARFDVSRESCQRLRLYVEELSRWQKRINLISSKTLDQVWVRHVADALQLVELLPAATRQIIDLGSGGGVPGLVLALVLSPERDIHVMLVESNAKKAAFLRHVAQKAGVHVTLLTKRIEELDPAAMECGADTVVTARALAPMPKLLELAFPMLRAGATGLFLKGQDVDKELTEATRYWNISSELIPSVTNETGVIVKVKEIGRA